MLVLSHGIRYLLTSPRETFTPGRSVAKLGGNGASWFCPFGNKESHRVMSKFDCRPNRSAIGENNS